jgi:alanine-glyoxylate transaminase/serine-glyoxylate transaminase/serine-pyruvate transaminase
VYDRHVRLARAVRAAVEQWQLEVLCADPEEYSSTATAVLVPQDVDSDDVLRIAEERFRLSLGTGLGKLKGKVFRIGHLGYLNELEVCATIAGAELALHAAGVPISFGAGVRACQQVFAEPEGRHR